MLGDRSSLSHSAPTPHLHYIKTIAVCDYKGHCYIQARGTSVAFVDLDY